MNITLDGFMSGPHCELDWHFQYWDEGMSEKMLELLDGMDTILLGRITYYAMAPYWSRKSIDHDMPRQDFVLADAMSRLQKIVFSKSRSGIVWNNSEFAMQLPVREIKRLKNLPGRDLVIFGSGQLLTEIADSGMIDEYYLWVHPVILGQGKRFFKTMQCAHAALISTVVFDSGVILLKYNMKKPPFHFKK